MAIRIKPVFSSTGTAGRVAVFDPATGLLTASVVTTDELELLSGITGGDILTETNVKTVSGKTFNQDLVADATNEHDIGSSGVRWKDAYLAGQLNAASGDFSGNVTIDGDLTVSGTTTTVGTTNLEVTDANILVNNGGNDATSEGAGLTVERTATNGSLIYADASATKWRAGAAGAEVDLVGTTPTQTLTNKTIVAASNTITTAASGNLTSTELNAALAELQTDIDTRATTTDLDNHLNDTSNAHAASAISFSPAGNIVATDVQAMGTELQGDIDALDTRLTTAEGDINTLQTDVVTAQSAADAAQTDIDNHIADTTAAHAASAIAFTPAGNIAASDVQAMGEELQADIDTRALDADLQALDTRVGTAESDILALDGRLTTAETDITALESDLATHIADTSTHGVSGAIVGTTDTQALSNKDIDGGTASDTSRITLPKNTKSNLDGLTRKEGTVVYGTDTQKAYVDDGTDLIPIGSGSGGGAGINLITLDSSFTAGANPNNFDFEDSTDGVGTWAVYADAAATIPVDMTGGSPGTTIARITSGELNGSASAQVDLGSGSSRQGEGWATSVHVPPAYRGRTLTCIMPYSITGAVVEDDLIPYCYDVTNSTLIKPYVKDKLLGSSGVAHFTFPVSTTTAEVRVGVHIARTSTTALSITFDDVQVSPFATPVGAAASNPEAYTPVFTGLGTVTGIDFKKSRSGKFGIITGKFTMGTGTATEAQITLPTGWLPDVSSVAAVGIGVSSVNEAASTAFLVQSGASYFTIGYANGGAAAPLTSRNGTTLLATGATVSFTAIFPVVGWDANVSMAESSTYFISSYLANGTRVTGAAPAKLGEYRSYLRNASGYTFTETNGSPTTGPSASNGMVLYAGNSYASNDSNNSPTKYDIFVGKNKNVKLLAYSSTGRTGRADISIIPNTSTDRGTRFTYDPTTGVATVCLFRFNNGAAVPAMTEDGASDVNPLYFDIQVSENALAVGVQVPRSEVTVDSGNGHGSTNNKIRRFSNMRKNVGSAITYADSATLGGSFTINEPGVYSVTYNDAYSGAAAALGITVNTTVPTTSISAPPTYAQGFRVYESSSAVNEVASVSWTGILNAGDIVRAHTAGTVDMTDGRCTFTIVKVSN